MQTPENHECVERGELDPPLLKDFMLTLSDLESEAIASGGDARWGGGRRKVEKHLLNAGFKINCCCKIRPPPTPPKRENIY